MQTGSLDSISDISSGDCPMFHCWYRKCTEIVNFWSHVVLILAQVTEQSELSSNDINSIAMKKCLTKMVQRIVEFSTYDNKNWVWC